jgi:hypothetical protein
MIVRDSVQIGLRATLPPEPETPPTEVAEGVPELQI